MRWGSLAGKRKSCPRTARTWPYRPQGPPKTLFLRAHYPMIQLFQTNDAGLRAIQQVENGCWINIVDPNEQDKAWLEEHCPLAVEYLTDSLDQDELSRVEKENDYLLVVLRIPHFRGMEFDIPFITLPLLIMQTEQYTITLCKDENAILQEFVRERVRGFRDQQKGHLLASNSLKNSYQVPNPPSQYQQGGRKIGG